MNKNAFGKKFEKPASCWSGFLYNSIFWQLKNINLEIRKNCCIQQWAWIEVKMDDRSLSEKIRIPNGHLNTGKNERCLRHSLNGGEALKTGEDQRMASSKKYLSFILHQLSNLDQITYRAMMGEYIIYYRGRIVGGIYDNRFLVKPVKAAVKLMPDASFVVPYQGAKEMLLVDNVDNKEFLKELLENMYDELPKPKTKK